MTKKLFVGGLSWGTKDEQLRAAFEKFGTVSDAKVILDLETGRSRGFGFVTFPDDDAGERAIQEMDGADLDGRAIRVNEAQERGAPPRGGGGGRGGPPPRGAGAPRSGGGGGGFRDGGGGGRGGDNPRFRNENRPPASRSGSGSGPGRKGGRGRGGERGGGEDRFSRRRGGGGGGGGGEERRSRYEDDVDSDFGDFE